MQKEKVFQSMCAIALAGFWVMAMMVTGTIATAQENKSGAEASGAEASGAETAGATTSNAKDESDESITVVRIVVMDPLSMPLACDCVEGYAQRKYEKLAQHIARQTGAQVKITWSESLKMAIEKLGGADLVIGKHSVVEHAANRNSLKMTPVAQLTNDDGTVHQTGLVVVRQRDEAISAADLIGYRIFFGPEDCDEKNAEPIKYIKAMGGQVPEKIETTEACSVAATKLVELDPETKAAAVISSYAKPLLEGCGTVKKGDLRVIGETEPVPFITAFHRADLDEALANNLTMALLSVADHPELLEALETKKGFVKFKARQDQDDADSESDESGSQKKSAASDSPKKK